MIRFRAAVLACAALTACKGSVTPPPVPSELYVLDEPAVLQNEVVRIEILSDILSFYANGTARREYRQRLDYTSPAGRDTTFRTHQDYTFQIDGSTIAFAAQCADSASCTPPPHLWGDVTASGLDLHSDFDPEPVLRYRRVP